MTRSIHHHFGTIISPVSFFRGSLMKLPIALSGGVALKLNPSLLLLRLHRNFKLKHHKNITNNGRTNSSARIASKGWPKCNSLLTKKRNSLEHKLSLNGNDTISMEFDEFTTAVYNKDK